MWKKHPSRALAALLVAAAALPACGQSTTLGLVGVDDPSQARPAESAPPPPPTAHATKPMPIPAEGGPPLDGNFVPSGQGWYCFDTPSTWLQCERSATGCDQDHSAALGPGIAIGECSRMDSVYAFTRKDSDGVVRFYPYGSMVECMSPVFGRKDSPDASGCAELH